jgi:hypothetical protein
MEDFSTLIYIIAAIIAFIASSRSGKKKATLSQPQAAQQRQNPPALENILNAAIPPDWIRKRQLDEMEIDEQSYDEMPIDEDLKQMDELGISPEEEGRIGREKSDKELAESEEHRKKEKILEDKFDAKKAIIYSSIINRKYF